MRAGRECPGRSNDRETDDLLDALPISDHDTSKKANGGTRALPQDHFVRKSGSSSGIETVPTFAFHLVPKTGEPSMSLVEAQSFDMARTLAVGRIKREGLLAIRLWDGRREIEVHPPASAALKNECDGADDRGARMIAMEAEGKTRRQIAEAFSITIARVHQLIGRARSRALMTATQPNRAALSHRAQHSLSLLIVQPETDQLERDRLLPERVAALTRERLLKTPNMGQGTVDEIELWLWERGLCLRIDP